MLKFVRVNITVTFSQFKVQFKFYDFLNALYQLLRLKKAVLV